MNHIVRFTILFAKRFGINQAQDLPSCFNFCRPYTYQIGINTAVATTLGCKYAALDYNRLGLHIRAAVVVLFDFE
jgi:hypothetical protein